jgi:glycosyltransferase involved in cell wall biosynthesis
MSKIGQFFVVLWYILRVKPEIIHVHTLAFPYVIMPSILLKAKCFYTVHNLADKDTAKGLPALIRKKFLKNRIKAVTISDVCHKSFKEFYGFDAYVKIENGCRNILKTKDFEEAKREIELLKKTKQTRVLINVARVMEQKNQKLLINTVNKLCKEGRDIILLIIGKYSSDIKMKEYLDSLITVNGIYFLGERENVSDYVMNADLFCLSSKWEGLPISLIESGLVGTYPVCTPVGGIPDVIVNEEYGILSSDISVDAYSKAILQALEKVTYKKDIKNLYQQKYSIKLCAEKYRGIFNSSINKHAKDIHKRK